MLSGKYLGSTALGINRMVFIINAIGNLPRALRKDF